MINLVSVFAVSLNLTMLHLPSILPALSREPSTPDTSISILWKNAQETYKCLELTPVITATFSHSVKRAFLNEKWLSLHLVDLHVHAIAAVLANTSPGQYQWQGTAILQGLSVGLPARGAKGRRRDKILILHIRKFILALTKWWWRWN